MFIEGYINSSNEQNGAYLNKSIHLQWANLLTKLIIHSKKVLIKLVTKQLSKEMSISQESLSIEKAIFLAKYYENKINK